jgi:hypothetical protein
MFAQQMRNPEGKRPLGRPDIDRRIILNKSLRNRI